MGKFKVGDRVRAVDESYAWGPVRKGDEGVIAEVLMSGYLANFPDFNGWKGEDKDFELVRENTSSYTITRPITIANLIAKAPRCHEWNAEFVAFCEKYPDGVENCGKFLQEAPQKWLDWLDEKGFVKKAERKYKAGDRFRDDDGNEFLLTKLNNCTAGINLVNITKAEHSMSFPGDIKEYTLDEILVTKKFDPTLITGALHPIED